MMYSGQCVLVGFCGNCDEHLDCVKVGYVLTNELFTATRFHLNSNGKLFILIPGWIVV